MSRLPEYDGSLSRKLRQRDRQMVRQADASAFSRSGARVIAPGVIASADFDGTGPSDLGTRGWMLGSWDDTPSILVLDGRNIVATLDAQDTAILALIDDLTTTQDALADAVADLTTQQAYLDSLISRDASAPTYNTGALTLDSTWHLVGTQAVITGIAIPTGKVRVTISLAEASIAAAAGASVIGAICYSVDSVGSISATTQYARLYVVGTAGGSSLSRTDTLTVPAGTTNIRAQCAYWGSGSGTSSINFASPRLMADVIGSS